MSTIAELTQSIDNLPGKLGYGGHRRQLPSIISIVLTQAARHRRMGGITEERFESQLSRLEREELHPRGLGLLMRDLDDGTTRFLVKERDTGMIRDVIDVAPA